MINSRYLADVNSLSDNLKSTTSIADFNFFTSKHTPVKSHSQLACKMQLRIVSLINIMVNDSVIALEQLCYIGALPVITSTIECLCNQLNSHQIDHNDSTILKSMVAIMAPVSSAQIEEKNNLLQSHLDVLIECSVYVHRMATWSQFTAQLFIGVGGINVIMKFLSFGSFIGKNHKEKLCGGTDLRHLPINRTTALTLLFTSIDCIIGTLSFVPCALFSSDGDHGGIGRHHSDHFHNNFKSNSNSSLSSIANRDAEGMTLQSPTTTHFSSNKVFCKILIRLGILPKLAVAFDNLLAIYFKKSIISATDGNNEIVEDHTANDSTESSAVWMYVIRLSALFFKFSKHESNIKDLIHNESVVLTMILKNMNVKSEEIKVLIADQPVHTGDNDTISIMELMVLLLKKLSTNPISQVPLEKAGCLAVLVPLLYTPNISRRCLSLVLETLHNLCRVNKKRQELSAMYGIIPFLISESINPDQNNNRSNIAIHMLCDLANSSAITRTELNKNNVIQHFANMVDSRSVHSTLILNSLSIWIQNDAVSVERILLEDANINILITLFTSSSKKQMNLLHVSFTSIFCNSNRICKAVGQSDSFVKTLIERLTASDSTIITLSYLKILQMLHFHDENPKNFAEKYQLISIMSPFINDKSHVYVFELAIKLCADFCEDFRASVTQECI